MLDFIVLTGFLGSGKTTLLRDFLAMPEGADTAVIVNEVGAIGLDGAILAEGKDGLRMASLANGCVCCMLGSDLAVTVEQLAASRPEPLRRMVLETSGLSKPGPILRSLASVNSVRLRVSVVATVDCQRGTAVAEFEEAAAQWAGAQAMVLTKRELATPAQVEAARAAASGINPLADIIDFADRCAGIIATFTPRASAPAHPPEVVGLSHPRIAVMLVRWRAKPAWDDLAAWLDNLAGLLGDRLLRVKGVVAVADEEQSLLVQSVGTMFSAPRPFAATGAPFLVVIARDACVDDVMQVTPVLPIAVSQLGMPDPFAAAGEHVITGIIARVRPAARLVYAEWQAPRRTDGPGAAPNEVASSLRSSQ